MDGEHPQPDPRTFEQLKYAVMTGDDTAASELVRRMGYPTVNAARVRLFGPDHELDECTRRALETGLRPYAREAWEHQLDRQRRGKT